MKKKLFIYALVLGGITLMQAGCTTYSFTSRSTKVNQEEINASEQLADVVVDYQKRITATSDFQKTAKEAKQQAIFQCLLNNNVDVLVDPIFQLEKRPVTGYRATVHGFAGILKVGKREIDRMIEKKYTTEEVERYLLLTNPDFHQYYYRVEDNGNVYNIKCTNSSSSKPLSFQQNSNKNKKQKEKKQRNKKSSSFKGFFGLE